jgi:predicted transcriptional regulator
MQRKRSTIETPSSGSPDDKFDVLFARTQLGRADLIGRWMESGLDWEPWIDLQFAQIADIEAGLAEADAGDFASAEEVEEMFAKYR